MKTNRLFAARLLPLALAFTGVLPQVQAASELKTILQATSDGILSQFDPTVNYSLQVGRETTAPFFTVNDDTSGDSLPLISVSTRASFGYLHLAYDNSIDHNASGLGHLTAAVGTVSWNDSLTINNPLLTGTFGYLRPSFRLSGLVSNTISDPDEATYTHTNVSFSFAGGNYSGGRANFEDDLYLHPSVGHATLSIDFDASDVVPANLDIPFVYGQPFPLMAWLRAYNGDGWAVAASDQVNVQFQWRGATVLDADFHAVNPGSYTIQSESTHDWAASQAFTEPAPLLRTISRDLTGLASLTSRGLAGTTCILQTSIDLATWADVQTLHFTGLAQPITYQATPGEPRRFFRYLLP